MAETIHLAAWKAFLEALRDDTDLNRRKKLKFLRDRCGADIGAILGYFQRQEQRAAVSDSDLNAKVADVIAGSDEPVIDLIEP